MKYRFANGEWSIVNGEERLINADCSCIANSLIKIYTSLNTSWRLVAMLTLVQFKNCKVLKLFIPKILLYSRLVFCFVIVILTFSDFTNSKWIVLLLLYSGVFADIFDGIIARKLNISTENFRLLDTIFDLLFYLSILFFIVSIKNQEIKDNLKFIFFILGLEVLMYLISLIRFKKLPSPHAILSKFWGLYLVIEFSLLILDVRGRHFSNALIIGVFVHLDRVLIYILLRKWEHDIPSSYHALLLRQGKQIKRNKIFNG